METVSASTFAGGSGTSIDPYQISNVYELQNMSTDLNAYYILVNDIDASATSEWNSGAGFVPIGTSSASFRGSFDGQGYSISNLYINRPSTNYIGLFGYTEFGSIKNIDMIDNDITGQNYVAVLVGSSYWSRMEKCYAKGEVYGIDHVGGLVGYDYSGSSNNLYATVNVSGSNNVGGLFGGLHYATLNNSYARGNVHGVYYTGGLIGQNAVGNIQKSYSTGYVESSYSGGLVGINWGGTILNSFWDTETSGQSTISGGTGKTTAEMKDVSTFTNESTEGLDEAWDFVGDPHNDTATEDIWDIDSEKNDGYPYLSWQVFEEPIEVTEYTLYADQDIEIGKITVWNDGDYLYVNYTITVENWYLTEINLDVGNELNDIPQNKKGNPIPGWFKYSWVNTTPETTWHLMVVNISDVGLSGNIIITAHAALANHNNDPVTYEGSWAATDSGENRFVEKGSWATYVVYEM
ncbi:MAG: hypothetical protein ACOC5D_03315 [Thermoplasmatota archaeon]